MEEDNLPAERVGSVVVERLEGAFTKVYIYDLLESKYRSALRSETTKAGIEEAKVNSIYLRSPERTEDNRESSNAGSRTELAEPRKSVWIDKATLESPSKPRMGTHMG